MQKTHFYISTRAYAKHKKYGEHPAQQHHCTLFAGIQQYMRQYAARSINQYKIPRRRMVARATHKAVLCATTPKGTRCRLVAVSLP